MKSVWNQNCIFPSFPSLSEDITADAAVIGGGICGILTAFFLQQEGLKVVLLEANTLCSGQTHLTTAKITWQHGLFYHRLVTQQGIHKAGEYAEANRQALLRYESLIRRMSVSCFFEKLPSYLYSTDASGLAALEQEKNAMLSLGLDCTLHSRGGFHALSAPDQAQFHPLFFLSALASGLTVYEHTRVLRVKENMLYTDRHTVAAGHIVFACHYPFPVFPGMYFLKMHQERSYVVAVKKAASSGAASDLCPSGLPPGMFYGIDDNTPSVRTFQDMILVGGQGHRTGKNSGTFRYQALRSLAAEYFPGYVPFAQWSAQDCVSIDNLPYIGRFSPLCPNWYIATGFHKWGMTLSMTAAGLLTNLICERPDPCEKLFSPGRHWKKEAWKGLLGEIRQASVSLSRSAFSPGIQTDAERLRPGEGCIARIGGTKTGIYKDENNVLHFVSPRCPHLGCELHWNPEEKTWDCPCHGSRFRATGELLDGPAQKGC